MKKIVIIAAVLFISANNVFAQESTAKSKTFMQITTIESVVNGGLGRSKMIITNPDGTQTESNLENLFSMVGINFGNIKQNEDKIVRTLKTYTDSGWAIDKVTSFTLSPTDNGMGIFMTRYLLSKEDKSSTAKQ
ncbi:MAG TPA: hypothetical protein PL045_10135 [Chitinophagaceae bacterium]|nr:hypothetical protein [Chitinophagaceae bacterium]